jgi:hypothetical protein
LPAQPGRTKEKRVRNQNKPEKETIMTTKEILADIVDQIKNGTLSSECAVDRLEEELEFLSQYKAKALDETHLEWIRKHNQYRNAIINGSITSNKELCYFRAHEESKERRKRKWVDGEPLGATII